MNPFSEKTSVDLLSLRFFLPPLFLVIADRLAGAGLLLLFFYGLAHVGRGSLILFSPVCFGRRL